MADKPNAAGTVECPVPGCGAQVQVFKYVERSARPSMFKGKFYGACSTHGRVIDASNAASQEHVLNRGEIWGASRPTPKATPAPAPAAQSTPPRPAPVPTPTPTLPAVVPTPAAPRRPWWAGWSLWEWMGPSS